MTCTSDTTVIALTLVRIFEGRLALDRIPRDTNFDTGFPSLDHSIVGVLGCSAKELWCMEFKEQYARDRSDTRLNGTETVG